MQLGNFSISLAVKDIEASKVFYEKLGFEKVGGDQEQKWLVLRQGDTKIGLFEGMFDSNILTFNPGWDNDGNTLDSFDDIRKLHDKFKEDGLEIVNASIKEDHGPAHFTLKDPDGNDILIDQHV